ncbi:glycosyltransferase family 87 protein [Candidatus Omnitrophota bacterium]
MVSSNNTSRSLSTFLIFLLLVFSLIKVWNYGQLTPGIDFYKFWAVGRAIKSEQINIYTDQARSKMGLDFLAKSHKDPGQGRFRWAAENCKNIATYSSPFFYSVFSVGSLLDYERDFRIYLLLRLFCAVFAIVVLCRLLRYSAAASMAFVIIFTAWFEPFLSDLRIANVNQIQLGLLALFLFIQSRYKWRIRDFLGGFILGLSLAFKPSVVFVLVMLSAFWLINGRFKKFLYQFAGIIASIICALTVSGILFGSIQPWSDWIAAMLSIRDTSIEVVDGNFSLSMLVYEWFGVRISAYLTIFFLIIGILFIRLNKINKADPEKDFLAETLMVGMGCVIYLLSGKLVWLHYLILTIPMILFVLRPVTQGTFYRRAFGVAAIITIGLIPIQLLFGIKNPQFLAISASAGTLILFSLGLRELKAIKSTT